MTSRPIGVFDSGLGGLTVVKELRKKLPGESVIYFGDLAHLPYGTKSQKQILAYSQANTRLLLKHKVKAIVIACNSSSSIAGQALKEDFNIPFVDVIQPAAYEAAGMTRNGRVGVIATPATIASGAYEKAIRRIQKSIRVFSQPTPLLVPLVEEGWLKEDVTCAIISRYLKPLIAKKIDTLILGCTHYPLLKPLIRKVVSSKLHIIDSAVPTVKELRLLLDRKGITRRDRQKGRLNILLSDRPGNFKKIGEKFLGEKMKSVDEVRAL